MIPGPLRFPPLSLPGLAHGFTLRSTEPQPLAAAGAPPSRTVQAAQIHAAAAAAVNDSHAGTHIPGVDALATRTPGLWLAIRTADCGPVFIHDPVHHAIALAHSGKKGTALGILPATLRLMAATFGSRPHDLTIVLGPCIRPPYYEIDFAADIARQAREAGAEHFHDCGENTGADLQRFHSYRVEQGNTGRHYAFLCLL